MSLSIKNFISVHSLQTHHTPYFNFTFYALCDDVVTLITTDRSVILDLYNEDSLTLTLLFPLSKLSNLIESLTLDISFWMF